jgi:hypothetical protein
LPFIIRPNSSRHANERAAHEEQRDLLADHDDRTVDTRAGKRAVCLLLVLSRNQKTKVAQEKIYLASWLLSADTATNARATKAIGGRFYDQKAFV